MNFSSLWRGKAPRLTTTLAVLTLSTLSSALVAAPLNKADIKFIGPIAADMQLKPYQTEHQDAIINTLLPSIQQPATSITVFGEKLKWQNLDKVNALTLGGLQALKFSAHAERFSQGTLTLKGIEKAQLFINGEQQTAKKENYKLALPQGDHQIVIIAEQVANWHDVEIDFSPSTDIDSLTFSSATQHGLSAKQLFDATTVSALSMAPDGKHYLVAKRHYQDSTGNQANVITELKNADKQTIYR
ncbi:hypothetical protein LCGC14_2507370, partial [marine sediment metagenome]